MPSDDIIFMPLGWHENGDTGEWQSLVQKRNKPSPSVRCTKGRLNSQPRQVRGTIGGGSRRAGNEQQSARKKSKGRGVDKEEVERGEGKKSKGRGVDKEGVCAKDQEQAAYWPAVNDKVEVKKNLGVALGWQVRNE